MMRKRCGTKVFGNAGVPEYRVREVRRLHNVLHGRKSLGKRMSSILWAAMFCFQAPTEILDSFPSVKGRPFPEAAQGTVTAYNVAGAGTPPLKILDVGETRLFGMSEDALYSTTNGGKDWAVLSVNPEEFLVGSDGALYARTSTGFYRTRDGGSSWISILPTPTTNFGQHFVVDEKTVYGGGRDTGFFVSQD